MSGKPPKRKRFLVKPLVQGRAVARMAGYWCVYHAVIWHALLAWRFLDYREALAAGARPMPFGDLYAAFLLDHYTLLVCAGAVFPIVAWDMLRLTHRVAGPLVRVEQTLTRLAAGQRVERIQFRDGDLLGDFEHSFNKFIDGMNDRIASYTADERASRVNAALKEEELLEEIEEVRSELSEVIETKNEQHAEHENSELAAV